MCDMVLHLAFRARYLLNNSQPGPYSIAIESRAASSLASTPASVPAVECFCKLRGCTEHPRARVFTHAMAYAVCMYACTHVRARTRKHARQAGARGPGQARPGRTTQMGVHIQHASRGSESAQRVASRSDRKSSNRKKPPRCLGGKASGEQQAAGRRSPTGPVADPRTHPPRNKHTANLRTKILDFRGFDSSRILSLRRHS